MRLVSSDDLDRVLAFPALIEALQTAFAAGTAAPERHHHAIGGGAVHLLMPAWTSGAPGPGTFLGTKIVNVFPGNGRLGLPAVLGTYLLQSGETGAPLAALDGTRLTHWRTAAVSGLAARHLARPDARRLVMVGAGALAPFLVRAHAAVRPIDHVTVWNRNLAGAERLAAALADPRWTVVAAPELGPAVVEADIVSCATLSAAPMVAGAWLKPGAHLDLVGAFTLAMREADDAALRRARLFVDTPAALSEGGDVALALRSGAIARDHVRGTLADLCRGACPGRLARDDITTFKAVGTAIGDLATAVLAWHSLPEAGRPA